MESPNCDIGIGAVNSTGDQFSLLYRALPPGEGIQLNSYGCPGDTIGALA